MASNYTSTIQTWDAANAYLGTKINRPLPHCSNLRIEKEFPENWSKNYWERGTSPAIVIKLHGHVIVRFPGPGLSTEYPYRGTYENTPTTKRHRSAFGGPWKV